MTQSYPHEFSPESLAYQNALTCWRDFEEIARTVRLDDLLHRPDAFGTPVYIEALNLLPPQERRPVAFGELAGHANEFSPQDFTRIRERILPDASAFELDTLEAVKNGSLPLPDKLPVTLEEFPSRIWQRAMASGSPGRLVVAGCQAVDTALRLLSQIEDLPDSGEENGFQVDVADIPDIFDLIALAPTQHLELKTRLLESLMVRVEAGESPLIKEVFETIPAWVLPDDGDSAARINQLIQDTRDLIDELSRSDRNRLRSRHRLRKLGRLLFRMGERKESLRAAKALGVSAWSEGWQFQPVGGKAHVSIRNRLLCQETNADAWQREPALACSAMSLPLWLIDGVSRVPELTHLFNNAGAFPWVFPQLHHVFQWHLAISKHHAVLAELAGIGNRDVLGLAGL
jgi:hypothetical protein